MEEKVNLGSTTEQVPSLVEQIRQIVREEVAAQLSQMQPMPITIGPVKVGEAASKFINEYMKPSQTWPLRSWDEASSNNVTWDSAKESDWDKIRSIVKDVLAALENKRQADGWKPLIPSSYEKKD